MPNIVPLLHDKKLVTLYPTCLKSYSILISDILLISKALIASLEKIKLRPRVTSTSRFTALKNADFLLGSIYNSRLIHEPPPLFFFVNFVFTSECLTITNFKKDTTT